MVKRQYPEAPIAAVGVVIREGGQIVLIRRSTEPSKGRWTFPGGVVRVGESLRHAVRREAQEETGLQVEVLDAVAAVDALVRDEDGRIRYHYVIVDLAARPVGGSLRAGSDASDARWVSLTELPQLDVTESAADVFRRALPRWPVP